MQSRGTPLYCGESVLFKTPFGELEVILQELDVLGSSKVALFLFDGEKHTIYEGNRGTPRMLGGLSFGWVGRARHETYGEGVNLWASMPHNDDYSIVWPSREE